MTRRWRVAALGLGIGLLLLWLLERPEPAPLPPAARAAVLARSATTAASGPSAQDRRPEQPSTRAVPASTPQARATLPRPSPAEGREDVPRRIVIAEQSGRLKDRRTGAGQDAPTELELIHAGLDTIQEDIEACLAAWAAADAQVDGKILIGFQLDETGLTSSWVDHGDTLPFGVKTCFASAVYGVDWSHIVKHPAEITNNYELSSARPSGSEAVH